MKKGNKMKYLLIIFLFLGLSGCGYDKITLDSDFLEKLYKVCNEPPFSLNINFETKRTEVICNDNKTHILKTTFVENN